jgi:hypothetical protein
LRRGWQWDSAIGLTSPKKHQPNYSFSRILLTRRESNVALTFSAEAIAEMAGWLG